MTGRETMRQDVRHTFLVPALVLLAFVAAPLFSATAFAQPDAQLNEMTENMKLVGNTIVRRKATSQLIGTANVGTPLCPQALVDLVNPGATTCTINATGSDNISLTTGLGKFEGTFTVVVQGDNPTDSPEFVVAKGKFKGEMDFSPAILGGVPLGTVDGTMKLDGNHKKHPFTGTFRLPFVLPFPDAALFDAAPLPLNPFPTKFYVGQTVTVANVQVPICTTPIPLDSCTRPLYLDDSFNPFPVAADEYGRGYPTVRFDVKFGQNNHHDDNDD